MDVLRSCYSTHMQLSPDPGDDWLTVRWFFCKEGAKPLPFPTVFNSRNWTPDKLVQYPLGEQGLRVTPWQDGSAPPWGIVPALLLDMLSWPDTIALRCTAVRTPQEPPCNWIGRRLYFHRRWFGGNLYYISDLPPVVTEVGQIIRIGILPYGSEGEINVVSGIFFDGSPFTSFGFFTATTGPQFAGDHSLPPDPAPWDNGAPNPVFPDGYPVDPSGMCLSCNPPTWVLLDVEPWYWWIEGFPSVERNDWILEYNPPPDPGPLLSGLSGEPGAFDALGGTILPGGTPLS